MSSDNIPNNEKTKHERENKMSVSLSWRPVEPNSGKVFSKSSNLQKIMEELFGDFPIVLGRDAVPKLEGVRACGYDDLQELIEALYTYENIKIVISW